MRDQQAKYFVIAIIVFVSFGFMGWGLSTNWWKYDSVTTTTLPAYAAVPVCGNGICEIGEPGVCATDCVGPTTPTYPTPTLPLQTLTCPSDADTKFEVNTVDILDEDAYTRLAVNVKKISEKGILMDTESSSATASTLMKVPCKKAQYRLIAYDDNNAGDDIYPIEVVVNGYVMENGQLMGGRIPVTIPVKIQGTLSLEIWDNTGTRADKNITIATGDSTSNIRIEVKQTEDDKAAEGVRILANYTISKAKKIEIEGLDAGVTAVGCEVPSIYAGEGGFEKSWCLFRNGQPLTLDGDSRTADPSSVLLKVSYYSYAATDPTQNTTWRAIDSMKYWEPDGATYAKGGALSAEDAANTNLGIQAASEGLDTLYIE